MPVQQEVHQEASVFGSILIIIFFPLLIMYVIIGVLINRYGRGIESMPELLPIILSGLTSIPCQGWSCVYLWLYQICMFLSQPEM
ncbi:hypothetical protein OS493_010755 [Desmophyllum pertusum]|uniref:Uncharacterized protein n=1 Tax=Desmophyllum pertusum TaxID=174260 RepID=A0A9W9ZGH9_9CNID|nr:hypothetical protein OS493_010755 [Desmophyllum pertusum]